MDSRKGSEFRDVGDVNGKEKRRRTELYADAVAVWQEVIQAYTRGLERAESSKPV